MLGIQDVPLATLIAFAEAVHCHPTDDRGRIAQFAGFGESTARKALPTLETLGLISRVNGQWVCRNPAIYRGVSTENGKLVIRQALQSFRAFEAICEGLAVGERLPDAIRKANLLLRLEAEDESKLEILAKWARELGVLVGTGRETALAPEIRAAVDVPGF